jgi:hypothetical protein
MPERFLNGVEFCSESVIKDSGSRSEFSSGAVRDCQAGKGRMDLLPMRAIMEVAKIMEEGAKKYEARNWEKGMPISRYLDSGLRHIAKWSKGDRDEPHLAQACWNFLCLLDTQERLQDGTLPIEFHDIPTNHIAYTDKHPFRATITDEFDHFVDAGKMVDAGAPNRDNWSE